MNNKVVLTSRGCHDENHMIFSQFREPDALTLCAYNILDLYNFDIDKLITSHSYVILDDPFIAFKKGKEID